MGPAETAASPAFPVLDPIIVDDEMENGYQDADMEFLDPARLQMSSGSAGQDFDDLLRPTTSSRALTDSESACLSPSELSVKRNYAEQDHLRQPRVMSTDSPVESPDNSSRSSSSESPRNNHLRHSSVASSTSAAQDESAMMPFGYTSSEDWVNPDLESVKEEPMFRLESSSMQTINHRMPMFGDLESSNKAMDAAFDFESAASSPSPLRTDATPQPKISKRFIPHQRRSSKYSRNSPSPVRTPLELIAVRADFAKISYLVTASYVGLSFLYSNVAFSACVANSSARKTVACQPMGREFSLITPRGKFRRDQYEWWLSLESESEFWAKQFPVRYELRFAAAK